MAANEFKVVLIGDSKSGKSSIIKRLVSDEFNPNLDPGALEVSTKELATLGGAIANLQLWDTVGSEKFYSLGSTIFKGTACCVLVCDLTSQSSFERLDQCITDFRMLSGIEDLHTIPVLLLANKADLGQQRQVHFKRIQTWCEEKNITPFEVSALEGVGITNAFKSVADECYARAQASISAEKPDGGPSTPSPRKKHHCIIL